MTPVPDQVRSLTAGIRRVQIALWDSSRRTTTAARPRGAATTPGRYATEAYA